MRLELVKFAEMQEQELKLHDGTKIHWAKLTQNILLVLLIKQQAKLKDAVCKNDHAEVIKRCINVANYSMMLADNAHNVEVKR